MVDTCTVQRPGEPVTDPVTGSVTPRLSAVYTGACKVQQTIAQSSNPTAGGHAFTVQDSCPGPYAVGPMSWRAKRKSCAGASTPPLRL